MEWIKALYFCSTGQPLSLIFGMASQQGLVTCPLARITTPKPDQKGWKNNWHAATSPLQQIFEETMKITRDADHILHKEHELMPLGKKYRLPNC